MEAKSAENLAIAELLLSHGAKVNARTVPNEYGQTNDWTPIFYAVYARRSDLVALLLKYRAEVNLTDKQGASPLYWATEQKSPEIAQQLRDAGETDHITAADLKTMKPPVEVKAIPDITKVALSCPAPDFPAEARAHHLTGTGIYDMDVAVDTGQVTAVRVLTSAGHQVLDRAAVKALRRWKFRPHTVVKVRTPITFTFGTPKRTLK